MKTIHPGHLEHRFCIFGCQILCITDLAIMPLHTKYALGGYDDDNGDNVDIGGNGNTGDNSDDDGDDDGGDDKRHLAYTK